MGFLRAQGATEYLVLLAVVLIVALVSVALLGFFPGMASDAQVTQSQMYWKSAQPIAISEWAAKADGSSGNNYPYLRMKNTGAYPIRITGVIGGDGTKLTQFSGSNCGASGMVNISDFFYLGPGEEKYFSIDTSWYGVPCSWLVGAGAGASGGYVIGGALSLCQKSAASPGTLQYNSFGFEYVEYLDNNQQITKREIGKAVIIKCMFP